AGRGGGRAGALTSAPGGTSRVKPFAAATVAAGARAPGARRQRAGSQVPARQRCPPGIARFSAGFSNLREEGAAAMALRIYYDKDADLGRLEGKTVAILGYGSQGHAHAQNLRASGVSVVVGLRKDSPSWVKAEGAGLRVQTPAEAVRAARITMMTLPDE